MLRLLLLLKRKNGLKQGGCSDDVDDVGQIEFIALSTGCMSMMMKVTATFDGRTRLHIEHLQEREQDAQFSKPQLCKFRCRAAPTPTEHAVGTSNRSLNLITKSYILYAETQSAIQQGLPPGNHPG